MSATPFSSVYIDRVLDPSYRNWVKLFYEKSFLVHKAHLCMLAETGIVDGETVRLIKKGLEAIENEFSPPEHIPGWSRVAVAPPGGGVTAAMADAGLARVEDLYFLVEKELGARIGDENAAWLHTARSRNDMDTTVFRLALKDVLLGVLEKFRLSCDKILSRAKSGDRELTVLFTHGQPANPSTTAHYLTAFLLDFLEDGRAIADSLVDVDKSSMGACAITGTGFPIDRARVAELLGLAEPIPNTYQAISTSHWLTRPAQALYDAMLDIGRFAADLIHKASAEVGLYDFPDELVQVSSIMPQKRNPVILEHLRIQSGQVAGVCLAVEESFRNVPYQDVNENADALVAQFLEILSTAGSVLDLLVATVQGMRSREERAEQIAAQFGVATTELADTLVREFGIGFRTAHGICSEFAHSGGDKVELRRKFLEKTGRELSWSDAEIDAVLDPRHFVEVRKTEGGPAAEGMKSVYETIHHDLSGFDRILDACVARRRSASAELSEAWARLR
jgi:argininosuccinate lyase